MSETNPGTRPERRRPGVRPRWLTRRWRLAGKLVLFAVVLLMAWRFSYRVGWHEVADRLLASDPRWVAAGVALLLARFLCLHHRWHLALRRLSGVPGRLARFFVLMSAIFVNHVTPTARILGGIFRARYLVREGGSRFPALYGTVLADVVSNQIVLVLMTWLAILVLAWRQGRHGLAWFGTVLLLGLTAASAVWIGRRGRSPRPGSRNGRLRRWAERREPRHDTLVEGGQEAVAQLLELVGDRALQVRMALWGGVAILANAASQWAIFQAIGEPVDPLTVTVTVALGAGIGVLAGVPGGVGATEAAMIAGYVYLGVGETAATAATLLYRGLHYGTIFVTGLPALVWFEFATDLRERQTPPPTGDRLRTPRPSAPEAPRESSGPGDGSRPDRDA